MIFSSESVQDVHKYKTIQSENSCDSSRLTGINQQDDSVSFRPARQFATADPRDAPSPEVEPSPGYLDQDARKFFYKWGGLLSATLIRIRGRFEGDLDRYLIYLVFLLADLSRKVAAGEAAARGARTAESGPRGLNALSIAEITRVPRETTRRKLQALVDTGYLVRGQDGLYYLTGLYGVDAFFYDLSPLFWDGVKLPR